MDTKWQLTNTFVHMYMQYFWKFDLQSQTTVGQIFRCGKIPKYSDIKIKLWKIGPHKGLLYYVVYLIYYLL